MIFTNKINTLFIIVIIITVLAIAVSVDKYYLGYKKKSDRAAKLEQMRNSRFN